MAISISVDPRKLEKAFESLGKQAPYAAMRTINSLAYDDVKPAFKNELQNQLDRPTRYTLNSIAIAPAKKNDLTARVFIRDEAYKGRAPADYLLPMAEGGASVLKRSERLLIRKGIMRPNQRLIPGRRAKLNAHGNWTGAQMNKALSNIGAQHDRYQNTNSRTRKRKGQTRYDYFLIPNGHPKLTPGIWKEERGWAYPWLIFAERSTERKKQIDLQSVADRTIDVNFNKRAQQSAMHALKTAWKRVN
ncbi:MULTISPECIES: hypothetical protein [Vibrio]|uniref:hypothetical protein n=1 Tax=Vibrio TaxID=662 RepID=UPI0022EA9F92|nr:hypothetical protein [Vibrio parahaemolyticus]